MEFASKLDMAVPYHIRTVLRGIGQVFFCCNAITGLFILMGLGIGSGIEVAAACLLGSIVSTIAANLLGFSQDDIDAGLYGFNGCLVGPCLLLVLEHTPMLYMYLVIGAILTSVVLAALIRILTPYKVPASTAPFIFVCWMLIVATHNYPEGVLKIAASGALPAATNAFHLGVGKAVGEVIFADSVITSILFLIGIALVSIRGAALALCGAVVGLVAATSLGAAKDAIEFGLYGFNPVLTMMALGWVFLKNNSASIFWAILGGIITVIAQAALAKWLSPMGVSPLTFPFVMTMWMFLFAGGMSKHFNN